MFTHNVHIPHTGTIVSVHKFTHTHMHAHTHTHTLTHTHRGTCTWTPPHTCPCYTSSSCKCTNVFFFIYTQCIEVYTVCAHTHILYLYVLCAYKHMSHCLARYSMYCTNNTLQDSYAFAHHTTDRTTIQVFMYQVLSLPMFKTRPYTHTHTHTQ